MERRVYLIIIGVVFSSLSYSQIKREESAQPEQPLTDSVNYRLTIEWLNKDMNGKLMMHNIASGRIIQLSQKSFVNNTTQLADWNLTEISTQGRNRIKLVELEGLQLKISGDNFTNVDFYKDFPPTRVELIRWIVQDKVAFGVYGQMYLDSLKLNTPYYPDFFQNQRADFDQYVNFNTQKLKITWLGFSEMNNENCMLIYFKSMYNPIDADNEMMTLNGRSCFWGNIWISPKTKQIEHATMNEDLVYTIKFKATNSEQQINMQREVMLEKID